MLLNCRDFSLKTTSTYSSKLNDSTSWSNEYEYPIISDPVIVEQRSAYRRPECCSLPAYLMTYDAAATAGGNADYPDPPPAGGYVDLNATHCATLLTNATPYCDKSYNNGLSLSNRTLVLRPLRVLRLESNWFWDFFSLESSSSRSEWSWPLLLACLLVNRLCCSTAVHTTSPS